MSLRQEVNLYHPKKGAGKIQLDIRSAGIACGLFLLALLLIALSDWRHASSLEREISDLEIQYQQLQSRLEQARASRPANRVGQLEAQHLQLQDKLNQLQQVSSSMTNNVGIGRHFSAQLQGLSEHHVEGISLQQIKFLNSGRYIEFSGQAKSAQLIPAYLERLQHDSSFGDSKFGSLSIEKTTSHKNRVDFRLGKEIGQ